MLQFDIYLFLSLIIAPFYCNCILLEIEMGIRFLSLKHGGVYKTLSKMREKRFGRLVVVIFSQNWKGYILGYEDGLNIIWMNVLDRKISFHKNLNPS